MRGEKAFLAAMQDTERIKLDTGREQLTVKHGDTYVTLPDTWAVRQVLGRLPDREIVYETRVSARPEGQ